MITGREPHRAVQEGAAGLLFMRVGGKPSGIIGVDSW